MPKQATRIAIIGARNASEAGLKFAYEVGRLLAERNVVVYTGGADGIMEAASRGVSDAGGINVGILKSADLEMANDYVGIPVMTGMGDLRNGMIIRSVQGSIAVEGSYGTLSEIAYTLSYGKPVVGFKTWDIPGMILVETPEEAVQRILQLVSEDN
jgi:uncharacterized protein (TIGR00725 family)